jgi:hypothetical protein
LRPLRLTSRGVDRARGPKTNCKRRNFGIFQLRYDWRTCKKKSCGQTPLIIFLGGKMWNVTPQKSVFLNFYQNGVRYNIEHYVWLLGSHVPAFQRYQNHPCSSTRSPPSALWTTPLLTQKNVFREFEPNRCRIQHWATCRAIRKPFASFPMVPKSSL